MTEINNITDRPGETLSRESALALIDEANRWQAAYNRVCDEKAEAEARLSDYEQAQAFMLRDVPALLVAAERIDDPYRQLIVEVLDAEIGDDVVALRQLLSDGIDKIEKEPTVRGEADS